MARPGYWSLRANGTLMARRLSEGLQIVPLSGVSRAVTCGLRLERAKGIEPS